MTELSLFDLLVILGIMQGAFIGFLLLFSKDNRKSNRLLALVLLIFVLLSFKILLHTLGLWDLPAFRYFPLAIDLTIQPLIYLYIVSITRSDFRIMRSYLLHFIPTFVFVAHALIVYIYVQEADSLLSKDVIAEKFQYNIVKRVEDYLSVGSFWIYWLLAWNRVKKYRSWLYNISGDMTLSNLNWVTIFLKMIAILLVSLTVNILLDNATAFGQIFFFHWQIFYLVIASTIYYLAIQGYRQPQIIMQLDETNPNTLVSFQTKEVDTAREAILQILIDQRTYADPEISLIKLSKTLNLSQNLVSFTINNRFDSNFRNLVNHYRVEEVKNMLKDPQLKHLSIFGIAMECGFNSEASFYRVFKKETGMSPKEFVQSNSPE